MIATWRMSEGRMRVRVLPEGALEQLPDRPAAVFLQEPRPGPGKPAIADPQGGGVRDLRPTVFLPREPAAPFLIEDEDRLFAELCGLGAPPAAPAPRAR